MAVLTLPWTGLCPAKEPSYPGDLTRRKVEVLRLVAVGRTDREITEDLIIGVRTVSTHVGTILNKTGANNRAEAANYANRQSPIPPVSKNES